MCADNAVRAHRLKQSIAAKRPKLIVTPRAPQLGAGTMMQCPGALTASLAEDWRPLSERCLSLIPLLAEQRVVPLLLCHRLAGSAAAAAAAAAAVLGHHLG